MKKNCSVVFSARSLPLELLHFGGFLGAAAVLSAIVVVATAALFFSTESRELIGHLKKNLSVQTVRRVSQWIRACNCYCPLSPKHEEEIQSTSGKIHHFSLSQLTILCFGGGEKLQQMCTSP